MNSIQTDSSGFYPERGNILQKENNEKLDALPSKTLPKAIRRASCPMVQSIELGSKNLVKNLFNRDFQKIRHLNDFFPNL